MNPKTNSLINPHDHLPYKQRLGRCYELAGEIALHNSTVELVHGSIQGFGAPRIGHAWVVLGDESVWEPATNRVWGPAAFQAFYNAKVEKRYDQRAFLELMVTHEHWGPWH